MDVTKTTTQTFLAALKAEAAKFYQVVTFAGQEVRVRPIEVVEKADIMTEAKRYGAMTAPIGAEEMPPEGLQKATLDALMQSDNAGMMRDFLGYVEPTHLAGQIMYYAALMAYRYFEIAHSLTNEDGTMFLPEFEDRVDFVKTMIRNPRLADNFKIVHTETAEAVLGNS